MCARNCLPLILLVFNIVRLSYPHIQQSWRDLAQQPHARWLQIELPVSNGPFEAITGSVDGAPGAVRVPESAAQPRCTVVLSASEITIIPQPQVVVSIIRREHRAVVVAECITDVPRVSRHVKLVVTRPLGYIERTVLGVVPGKIATCLEVESQPVAAA